MSIETQNKLIKTNVILFLTPFHIVQFNKVKNEITDTSDFNIIFHNKKSGNFDEEIRKNTEFNLLPDIEFNFYEILYNPIKIFHYRTVIKQLRKYFITHLSQLQKSKSSSLIVFSFHGIVPQILRTEIQKFNPTIYEIEEGLSYYYKYSWLDKLLSRMYDILTPLLLNYKLDYRGNLGRNKTTHIVYARFPELLPNKNKSITYKKIRTSKPSLHSLDENDKNVLIFTSPFSEYKLLPVEKERDVLRKILNITRDMEYITHIKFHPREIKSKYKDILKDEISLEQSIDAEKINYHKYNKIIHFGSSVILDLFEKEFQRKHIISIKIARFSRNIKSFLDQTYSIDYNKDFKYSLRKALDN